MDKQTGPKVSILVPVYGVEKYIEKCARSLFSQDYGLVEYIFVDDHSPDNSIGLLEKIIPEYPERIPNVRIIRHEKNRGLSAARNTAVENSTGNYIWHVDSDDYIERGAVSMLVETVKDTAADMVIFDMNAVYPDRTVKRTDKIGESKEEYIRRLLHREVLPGVCGKFFSRSLFFDHGIRFEEGLNYGEDYVMSPRLAYFARKIVKLDAALYNYNQFNSGAYSRNINRKSLEDITRAVDMLDSFFRSVPDAGKYVEYLDLMKLRNKADLLKGTDTELRKAIAGLYPEADPALSRLAFTDRVVIRLAEQGRWGLLDTFVKAGHGLKKFLGLK